MHSVLRTVLALLAALLLLLAVTVSASAHVLKTFGTYTVALGWVHEPAYVGEQNAVQVVVKDDTDQPVSDLASGDLKVTVSVGGQTSNSLDLSPTFDEDTGLGTPGDYEAVITPTAVGDYTFHLTGSIKDTAIDETATSSEQTFDSVTDPTEIQFPAKLPDIGALSTKVDRVDSRASATDTTASAAKDTATIALAVGIVAGGLGIVLGAAGIWMARRPRRSAG